MGDRDKRTRAPSFRLEFPGDADAREHLREKIQEVRLLLGIELNKPVNNYDILDYSLSCCQEKYGKDMGGKY